MVCFYALESNDELKEHPLLNMLQGLYFSIELIFLLQRQVQKLWFEKLVILQNSALSPNWTEILQIGLQLYFTPQKKIKGFT